MIKDNLELISQVLLIDDEKRKVKNLRDLFSKFGHTLNPNDKVILGISKGLVRCNGECPCDQGNIPIEDKLCPCKNFKDNNLCKCNLYIN